MKKVYLSPSNQIDNVGTGDYGTENYRMTQIAEVVERELTNKFEVKRARTEQALAERVNVANNWSPDVYVAIHSNAGGGEGCEVYAYSKASVGNRIANLIYSKLEAITPSADRGIKYNTKLYELKATNMAACLIEVAFHDNVEDANWIINNIELIGKEIAKAIFEYFETEYIESNNTIEKQQISGATANVQKIVNERYGFNIVVDNLFGNETKKVLTKALQTELNKQFGKSLVVDGIFGPATKAACINVRKGARGNISWLIQAMLVCKGYDIEVDGIFGSNTEAVVRDFQSKNGLVADGIVGKSTFEELFK